MKNVLCAIRSYKAGLLCEIDGLLLEVRANSAVRA
jgi:hypothetical protein